MLSGFRHDEMPSSWIHIFQVWTDKFHTSSLCSCYLTNPYNDFSLRNINNISQDGD